MFQIRSFIPFNSFLRHTSDLRLPQRNSFLPSQPTYANHPNAAIPRRTYTSYSRANTQTNHALLVAAEDAWLQPDDVLGASDPKLPSPYDLERQPSPRFDWRKRAPSRTGFTLSTPDKRKRYPRRKTPILSPVEPGEPYFEAIEKYQNHFIPLLESEEAENRNEINERLSTWSLERLKNEGYTLTDLSAYWLEENQYGKPVAAFQYGPGIVFPENHKFDNGMQIMVSRADPLEETPYKGSIIQTSKTQFKVCFPTRFDVDGCWRVDLDQMNLVYERMRKAISYLHFDPSQIERMPSSEDQEHVLLGSHLRDILLRSEDESVTLMQHNFHALQASDDVSYPKDILSHDVREYSAQEFDGIFKGDMRIHSWVKRYSLDEPMVMEGDPLLKHLNRSQVRAMATMIGKRISLVQGPPGTGKTKTIIETIKLLKAHFEVPHPILVCTYTNVAVDNLLEGFIKAGLKPLRVGYGSRIRASLQNHSLDYLLLKHPLQKSCISTIKELKDLEDDIDRLGNRLEETIRTLERGEGNKALEKRAENMYRAMAMKDRQQGQLKGKIYGMQQEMLHDIVKSADVICTTCITSASAALNVSDFPVVFIDEASMSTEPATLIPIMKGSKHVALIGDHKQLPPVIVSQEAQSQGLGVSLFERLTEEGIVPSVMLDIQYRMHPSISYFPSLEFYNNAIQDGTKDKEGKVVSGLEPPLSTAHLLQDRLSEEGEEGSQRKRPSVIFLDHYGYESMKGRSRVNHHEAQIVVSLVEDLLLHNPKLRGQDIGIIAPYVAQIHLLGRLLTADERYKERFREVLGMKRFGEMKDVEVKTVDGFEGREKEVIVFSTVRNNENGKIGFLADRRRLNVGLTRAKRGLFVVGSMKTIGGSEAVEIPKRGVGKGAESWKRYAEWLAREGLVLKLVGDKLNQTLYGNLKKQLQAR